VTVRAMCRAAPGRASRRLGAVSMRSRAEARTEAESPRVNTSPPALCRTRGRGSDPHAHLRARFGEKQNPPAIPSLHCRNGIDCRFRRKSRTVSPSLRPSIHQQQVRALRLHVGPVIGRHGENSSSFRGRRRTLASAPLPATSADVT
jgi:hypothetical protein